MAKSPYDDEERFVEMLRKAFGESVKNIKDRASLRALISAIEAGDVERVLRILNISNADFERIELTLEQIYREAGGLFAEQATEDAAKAKAIDVTTESRIIIQFSSRNPRAERIIREQSSNLVQQITESTKEAIRQNLFRGLAAGDNPRATALRLVGRIEDATKTRQGGIIGLTDNQESFVDNYRRQIASTDPDDLRNAMSRGLRDRRFDRAIAKAIETGQPIPAKTQAKMLRQYQNRMLKYRADVIARNEALKALGKAHREQWEQAAESGKVSKSDITRKPDATNDRRTRPTHLEAERMNAEGVGFDEPFQTPFGPQMECPYPGEVMCRCRTVYNVNYLAVAARGLNN